MTQTKRIISFVYDSTTGNIINIRNNTTIGKYVDGSILMKNLLLKCIMLNICSDDTSTWSDNTIIRVSENMPDSLKKSICNITHALSYEYEEIL